MSRSEAGSGAAIPWVAIGGIVLFTLATLWANASSTDAVERARRHLSTARTSFLERPYLEVGPLLRARISHQTVTSARRTYEQNRAVEGGRDVMAGVLRRQQAELDDEESLAAQALDELPARNFGVDPSRLRPGTLVTYVLFHSGVGHLAGSALLLVLLGFYLEPMLGSLRTSLIALGATFGAGVGYAFASPDLTHVMIGSSGLLAGLLAVFAVVFQSSRQEGFYAATVVFGMGWLALPAVLGVGWSFDHPGSDLLGARPQPNALSGAYGGGLVGAVATLALTRLLGGKATGSAATHSAKRGTEHPDLDSALALRQSGRHAAAFERLSALLQRDPEAVDAALVLADVARSLGRKREAENAMLHAIRVEAKRGQGEGAVAHWLAIASKEIPAGADPGLLVRLGGLLRVADHPRAASTALRAALERARGSTIVAVAARVAEAAREFDPVLAHDAAWRALGSPELSLEQRQKLESLLEMVLRRMPGAEVSLAHTWSEDANAPAVIELEDETRTLDVISAVPLELDTDGLQLATATGIKRRVSFERIDAIGVTAVEGLGPKPVLVIDLVLNWGTRDPRLRVIRLRGDKFDPRSLAAEEMAPLDAVRALVMALLEHADATPLPDRDSALGRPFSCFQDLPSYERTVLRAERSISKSRG